jgi:hypothetical protein
VPGVRTAARDAAEISPAWQGSEAGLAALTARQNVDAASACFSIVAVAYSLPFGSMALRYE